MAAVLLAAVVAELAGVIAAVLATRDTEAAGLGSVVPAFLLPSVVLYLGAISLWPNTRSSGWAYWLPVIGFNACMVVIWLGGGEGSGYAHFMGIVITVASMAAYITLRIAVGDPLQLSVKSALAATFWASVWFAAIAIIGDEHGVEKSPGPFVYRMWLFFLIASPTAFLGALFERHQLGLMCGAASGLAVIVWEAIAG